MTECRDYPKCKMPQDETATRMRKMIACWLRDLKFHREDDDDFLFDLFRDTVLRPARLIRAIDENADYVLWNYSYALQRKVKL